MPQLNHKTIGLILGPCLMATIWLSEPPKDLSIEAWRVAGIACLMGVWWATEAIPLVATALLPMALGPLMGILPAKEMSLAYASPTIYLLLGGFIVALGLERWNLHKRIALNVLIKAGQKPGTIIGGFMLATALLSMWISNTASTLMMIPIALSIASVIAPKYDTNFDHRNYTTVLLLGVAYAASIGGVGTLIGTAPNILVAGYLYEAYGIEISFATWAMFGLPMVAILLPAAWFLLTKLIFPVRLPSNSAAQNFIASSLQELGQISRPERRMLTIFICVALSWMFRSFLNQIPGLENLSDTAIALIGALALFIIPSGDGSPLMTWGWAKRLPWDVLLLYGGSIALASIVSSTGLGAWLGDHLLPFTLWPELALIALIVIVVLLLTELLNNSATVAAFLPVLGALADARDMDPIMLALPTALAASCAFMLPVATPPNTIVFGTGRITLGSMVRGGAGLNMLAIIFIPFTVYALMPYLMM